MKKQLPIYTLFTFILLTMMSVGAQAQDKLPQGEWIYRRGLGNMTMQLTAVFGKDQVAYKVASNGKEIKDRGKSFKILKSVVKDGKGKMLLKEVDGTQYAIGFFYQKNKDEVIMMPAEPAMADRQKAEKMFENAEKEIAKEMLKRTPAGVNKIKFDPYTFGWVWRSKKKVEELSALPTLPELDKKETLKIMDSMIAYFKKEKLDENSAMNMMVSMRLMETMLIDKGYNPYTSMGNLMKSQMKFSADPDVQKKAKELQEVQMGKKK